MDRGVEAVTETAVDVDGDDPEARRLEGGDGVALGDGPLGSCPEASPNHTTIRVESVRKPTAGSVATWCRAKMRVGRVDVPVEVPSELRMSLSLLTWCPAGKVVRWSNSASRE